MDEKGSVQTGLFMKVDGDKYVHGLQSATSVGAATILIRQAVHDPTIFFYGELLRAAQAVVARLGAGDSGAHLTPLVDVLRVLSHGVVRDVAAMHPSSAALVDSVVLHKLRQLTILTVCAGTTCVTYADLGAALGVPADGGPSSTRLLEDVVLDAMANGLLSGLLHQKEKTFLVHYGDVQAREIADPYAAAASLRQRFGDWMERCDNEMAALHSTETKEAAAAAARVERRVALQKRQEQAMEMAKATMFATINRGGDYDDDATMGGHPHHPHRPQQRGGWGVGGGKRRGEMF